MIAQQSRDTVSLGNCMANNDPMMPRTRWKLGTWAFLMTAAAGAGGYYTWQFRQQSIEGDRLASTCQAELGPASARADACEQERNGLTKRTATAEASLAQTEGNLNATRGELEELRKWRSEAAQRMQRFREMSQKLHKMVESGKLGVRVRDGRLLVRLPEHVLFPSGSADLSREGELALMEVAIIISQFPEARFMVAGHTDDQPIKSDKYRDNRALSTERALAVSRYLLETKKIKPQSLVVAGYGEFDPIASNKSAAGRRENRRIEIVLLPDLSELPSLPEDMEKVTRADGSDAPKRKQ
jgi:chemotaxis protein MotB